MAGRLSLILPGRATTNSSPPFLPMMAFGLIGIFLGPTLLAVGMNMVKEFAIGDHQRE